MSAAGSNRQYNLALDCECKAVCLHLSKLCGVSAHVRVAVACSEATQESSHSPQRPAGGTAPAAAEIPAGAGAATEPMEADAPEYAALQHADAREPRAKHPDTTAACDAATEAEADIIAAAVPAAGQDATEAVDAAIGAANKENVDQDGSQPTAHHTLHRSGPDATPTHATKAASADLAADEVVAATPGSQPGSSQPSSGAKRQRTGKSGTPRSGASAHPAAKPSTVSPLPASSSPVTPSPKAAGGSWSPALQTGHISCGVLVTASTRDGNGAKTCALRFTIQLTKDVKSFQ